MTQKEAIDCLKKAKGWITSKEVAKKTGMSRSGACRSLLVLFNHHEVIRKQVRGDYNYHYEWRIK